MNFGSVLQNRNKIAKLQKNIVENQKPTGSQEPLVFTRPQASLGFARPRGPAALNGAPGQQRSTGPVGTQRPAGPIETREPAGPVGTQGPARPIETREPARPVGTQGPAGLDGATGQQGLKGPVGTQGPAGPDGATGQQGLEGPVGTQGPAGPAGPAGFSEEQEDLKTAIEMLGENTSLVFKLRPQTYLCGTGTDRKVGFLAEQAAETHPLFTDSGGVNYRAIVVFLLEEVRRQKALVEELIEKIK